MEKIPNDRIRKKQLWEQSYGFVRKRKKDKKQQQHQDLCKKQYRKFICGGVCLIVTICSIHWDYVNFKIITLEFVLLLLQ